MELLIAEALWQPRWQGALQAWQEQGNRWQLLRGRGSEQPAVTPAPWARCPPDGILSASGLLAAPAPQQLPTVALPLPPLQHLLPARLPERLFYQQFHPSPCDRRTAQHNRLLMVC